MDIDWEQFVLLLDTVVVGNVTLFNMSEAASNTHVSETATHTFLIFSHQTHAQKNKLQLF